MAGSTAYNLDHMQVAEQGASPVYRDVNYAISLDVTIDQSDETLQADGKIVESTFGPREGSGSISFGSIDLATIALMTGDPYLSDETTVLNERLTFKGESTPPGVILVGWVKNVSSKSPFKGTRIIIPNAKIGVPNASFEQSSWSELEADITVTPDENDDLLIWENTETDPAFTDGTIPVELEWAF